MPRHHSLHILVASVALMAACAKEQTTTTKEAVPAASATEAMLTGESLTPDPGGKVVKVDLVSDEDGNYFSPAEVHVKRGDVVRYTLKIGVHNVHFLADSNAGKSGYPQNPSDFLQLPGQTWDVLVRAAPGSYYFQCDPHAALGMKGHLIVE
jgi:plastocyanin